MTERRSARRNLRAVKGMNDILPPESARWEWFEDNGARAAARATATRTCARRSSSRPRCSCAASARSTDIVEKEMYSFEDAMNGDKLTLRPENTAGVVRAMIEHNAALRRAAAPVVRRSDVPPRAAAEGPLSPVPPDRRRGARLRRARTSTPS